MEQAFTEREITQLQESINRIEEKLELLPQISSEINNIQDNQVRIENEYSQLQIQTNEIQRNVDRNSFVIELVSWVFIVMAGVVISIVIKQMYDNYINSAKIQNEAEE